MTLKDVNLHLGLPLDNKDFWVIVEAIKALKAAIVVYQQAEDRK